MNQLSLYENKGGGQNFTPLFDNKKLDLLKNTICKGSNDDEFELFLHACQRTGLDPFMKQIYAVKRPERQKDGTWRESMSIQTAIDGYRLIAERTGKYSPGKEPTYQYDQNGNIVSATAYVKKQTADGTWHEVAATAFFNEYCQKTKEGKPTKFWMQLGHAMIAKCAEALALRKSFPAELSGLYTKEEMMQAEIEDVTNLSQIKVDTNMSQQTTIDHIAQPLEMIDNKPKSEEKKYISKSQIVEYNLNYEKCDEEFQKYIDDIVSTLKIPDLSNMEEKTWKKFMATYRKYFDEKNKVKS